MSVRTDESYETGELSYVVVEGLWGWLNADMLSCIEGVRQGGRERGLNCGGFLPGSGDRTASLFSLPLSLCFVQRPRIESVNEGCEN